MSDVDGALRELREGNGRWEAGGSTHPHEDAGSREQLVTGQHPSVIVVSCSDSRVPPELVFDRGLGDLFVVRTAGEVLDEAALGTIAYGVGHLRVPAIVVLGHASCGAVVAAVDAVDTGAEAHGYIGALVTAIGPAVRAATQTDHDARIAEVVELNVRRVVDQLTADPQIVGESGDRPAVVGACYDLASGHVTWL